MQTGDERAAKWSVGRGKISLPSTGWSADSLDVYTRFWFCDSPYLKHDFHTNNFPHKSQKLNCELFLSLGCITISNRTFNNFAHKKNNYALRKSVK